MARTGIQIACPQGSEFARPTGCDRRSPAQKRSPILNQGMHENHASTCTVTVLHARTSLMASDLEFVSADSTEAKEADYD